MKKIYDCTIKLIRYALNGEVFDFPNDVDFELLYAFARSHGVDNISYIGLRDLKIDVPKNILQKFYYSYLMSVKFGTVQVFELEKIKNEFEKNGIDYIPMKGSVIKKFYPMPHYRKSGDIDILINPDDEETVRKIFEDFGYKYNYIYEGTKKHFAYRREFIEVEAHRMLVEEDSRAYDFLSQAWNYATPKCENSHLFEFDINFLYVHLIAHIAEHLYAGGAGLRLFSDIWIINSKNLLDRAKVNEYLKKANLDEIEKYIVKLTKRWFADEMYDDSVLNTLELFVLKGGSFGNFAQKTEMRSQNASNKKAYILTSKIKQFFKFVFEPISYMKQKYPTLIKHNYLLPIMWVWRIVTMPFLERNKIVYKLNSLSSFGTKNDDNLKNIYEIIKPR